MSTTDTNAPASALLAMAQAGEFATLSIDERNYDVHRLDGREKVSELFSLAIACESVKSPCLPHDLVGARASLTLSDRFGATKRIDAVVAAAHTRHADSEGVDLALTLRPRVFALTLSRDSRVFQDMTARQIVERVMSKTSAPYRFELTDTYPKRIYTVQYRESDWMFVSRLLEEEGIHYWFDHDADETTIVFSDHSTHNPFMMGDESLSFSLDTAMTCPTEVIYALASEAHATATKFTVGSFDPWNPALKVIATEGDGIHEMYDAPGGGPEDPATCRRQAKQRFEGAQSRRAGVSGKTNSIRPEPGRRMRIADHPLIGGEHFVTETRYRVRQRLRFTVSEEAGFHCHFEAIASEQRFRAPEDTPVSRQAGLQTGRVVGPGRDEIHTDDRGRVRVQMHWDREGGWNDAAGKWMRVAQRGVSSSMLYPRIGWNVTTFMEEGNVNAPMVLSRLHDASHPPTYALPEHKTRTTFRTQTTPSEASANEVRFEDKSGIQQMLLNASRDMNYRVKNDYSIGVTRDHQRIIGNNHTLTVGSSFGLSVKNDQSWSVDGDEDHTVEQSLVRSVGANETETIAGKRKMKVGSDLLYQAKKARTLEVSGNIDEEARQGLIKLKASTAALNISGSVTHTIGGVHQRTVNKDSTVHVSGNKVESCSRSHVTECNGHFDETVSGNLQLIAQRHMMDGADETSHWRVGGGLTAQAKHVLVQAKAEIVIKVGSSSITITPKDIIVRTPSYELKDASALVVKAKKVSQNA